MGSIQTAVIIGNGNVGSHLGEILPKAGVQVLQISNSKIPISELNKKADIYIIAVKDDAIENIYSDLIKCLQRERVEQPSENKVQLIVHTSGAKNQFMSPSDLRIKTGVLYFLQSFSKGFPLDFSEIPVCIEAQDRETETILFDFVNKLSKKVEIIDSQKRASLHLAAVFANNFGNLMFSLAQDIAKKAGLSAHLLDALISQTASKATEMETAWKAQTGPALREDLKSMEKHKELLKEDSKMRALYECLSEIIKEKKQYNNGKL